jgi:Domain of unknown function (DUF4234)
MADDTAHIAPGPPPDPDTAAPSAIPPTAVEAADTASPSAPPALAETAIDATAMDADIDVIGRIAAPVASLAREEPVAVLVGAASVANDAPAASGVVTPAAPAPSAFRSASGLPIGDDAPLWSFRGHGGSLPATPAAPPDDAQVELPFTAPPEQPAPPTARPRPTFGPVGRARSTVVVPLLAVVSLGVYALVWHRRVNRELEEFDPKLHSRPGRSTLAVAIPWLLGMLVTLGGAALIVTTRLSIHIPFDTHLTGAQAYYLLAGLVAVPYLTLVLPFSLIAVVMTLERIRCVEEHVGTTTDRQVRPVATLLLLAIPVVGGPILLAVEQGRANAIWAAVAPAGFFPN